MISYKREGSVLHTKSFSFAVRIVKLFKYLSDKDYKMGAIFNQLLRSGTSISANVHESEFAELFRLRFETTYFVERGKRDNELAQYPSGDRIHLARRI